MAIYQNKIFIAYKSIIVIYAYNGIEDSRIDLKKSFNINQLDSFEIDEYGNVWLFEDNGNIYVLDQNYDLKKTFNHLGVDKVDRCLNIEKDNNSFYYCGYYNNNELGLLAFRYNENDYPIYTDYYAITQGVELIDLNYFEEFIYFTTETEVYNIDINSNMKLPWGMLDIDYQLLGTMTYDEVLFLVENSLNSSISIINKTGNSIYELDFQADNFIDASIIDNYLVLLTKDELMIYSIEEDSEYLEFNSSVLGNSSYTSLINQGNNLVVSIRKQGFKIGSIDNLFDYHIIPNMTPSIDGYNAIKLLSNGDLIGIGVGRYESGGLYSGIFHKHENGYANYIPSLLSGLYYLENNSNTTTLSYRSGEKSPVSIIELDSKNIIFPNSVFFDDGSEDRGGIIQLNLDSKELVNIYNSDNSNTLGGFNGIFGGDSQNEASYTVINEIEIYNNKIWIVNPYNELHGDVISSYNLDSGDWRGINVGNPDNSNDSHTLYLPQGIAFDNTGQLWISFSNKDIPGSNQLYSHGGIRYVNSNNQFQRVNNDEILIGGENSDIWSIDVCRYNDSDILWVLSSDGVQGYTIFNNELNSILPTDLFIDIPFDKGDRIKCDQYSNVWITTMHSGVRVILSEGSYIDSWPSFSGLTSDSSGLLSDIVYDIDFNNDTGEIYFSTDLGISILESPFGQVSYYEENKYKIYFDKNPFLVPKDEKVIISNIPLGSTLKIMTLDGRVLKTLNEDSFTMYEWDGKNEFGIYVHSGVYIVVSFNSEEKTAVGKLAVIREE